MQGAGTMVNLKTIASGAVIALSAAAFGGALYETNRAIEPRPVNYDTESPDFYDPTFALVATSIFGLAAGPFGAKLALAGVHAHGSGGVLGQVAGGIALAGLAGAAMGLAVVCARDYSVHPGAATNSADS